MYVERMATYSDKILCTEERCVNEAEYVNFPKDKYHPANNGLYYCANCCPNTDMYQVKYDPAQASCTICGEYEVEFNAFCTICDGLICIKCIEGSTEHCGHSIRSVTNYRCETTDCNEQASELAWLMYNPHDIVQYCSKCFADPSIRQQMYTIHTKFITVEDKEYILCDNWSDNKLQRYITPWLDQPFIAEEYQLYIDIYRRYYPCYMRLLAMVGSAGEPFTGLFKGYYLLHMKKKVKKKDR
jgi:hypothetical protein